jgi:hypothetical protein
VAAAVAADRVGLVDERGGSMNSNRLIGMVLMGVGFGITVLAGAFLAIQTGEGALTAGGAVIGAFLAFIPIALFIGFGWFLYIKGGQETEQESMMYKQRQLLDLVKTRGQVEIHSLAVDMQISVDMVKDLVRQLVGLQVFSGYVNWDDGILYSADAGKLRDLKQCEKCGAPITLAGKGVVVCKYCGTEYFLP